MGALIGQSRGAPTPGTTVGDYALVRFIGQGGMATVYEAVNPQSGQRVALKILHDELARQPEMAERFVNEARSVRTVSHPGLISILDCGRTESGCYYIAMELLEGLSLEKYLEQRGHVADADAIEIGCQIAGALVAVHQYRIVHRDLKPANIFIVDDDSAPGRRRIKILDFGIAKLTRPAPFASRSLTRIGTVLGTPHYMSPEQWRDLPSITTSSDVYSLGVNRNEGARTAGARKSLSRAAAEVRARPAQWWADREDSVEEGADGAVDFIGGAHVRQVAVGVYPQVLGTGDVVRQVLAHRDRNGDVVTRLHDQRGHAQPGDVGAVIRLIDHARHRERDVRPDRRQRRDKRRRHLRPVRGGGDDRPKAAGPGLVVARHGGVQRVDVRLLEAADVAAVVQIARGSGEEDHLGEALGLLQRGEEPDDAAHRVTHIDDVAQLQLGEDLQQILGVAVHGAIAPRAEIGRAHV